MPDHLDPCHKKLLDQKFLLVRKDNLIQECHMAMIDAEHFWEHQMPQCKRCGSARKRLREMIIATRR